MEPSDGQARGFVDTLVKVITAPELACRATSGMSHNTFVCDIRFREPSTPSALSS